MINEGNSLAELQAKVLLASRHEKKSVSSLTVRLDRYLKILDELPNPPSMWQTKFSTWMSDKLDAWAYAAMMNASLPTSSSPKASPRVTSAAGSQLAGRRASAVILDDPHIT